MDTDRFDALTRSLIDYSSRRRVIAVIGGLVGGAGLGAFAVEVDAKKGGGKKKGRKKKKDKKNDNRNFNPNVCDPNRPLAGWCGGTCCDPGVGQLCCGGKVCCKSGQYCSPYGLCGDCPPCQPPDQCINGYCISCDPGYTVCIQPNGAPVCCHTNPPEGGTPMQCIGGYCVRPET